MTLKNGLALSPKKNLLNYLATCYENKGNSMCLYVKSLSGGITGWKAQTHTHTHTQTKTKKKMRGSHTFRFNIPQFKDMTFICTNMDDILQLSIILSEVKKRSVENKVVKRLKIPRISSTRSGIDMLFGKIPPCMHAQIQQIEIYSPLDPPNYWSLFIYACTAI